MSFDKYKTKGAYHYQWYESGEPSWYKKSVDRIVKFCKGSTLDFGCGDGLVCKLLSDKGYSVSGYDPEPEAIKLAKQYAPKAWFYDDLFPMITHDYLACLNVIEHMEDPELLLRLLNGDFIYKGAIIITDIPQEHPSSYHVKEYSPKELADLFKDYRTVPFRIDKDFHGIEIYK